MPLKADDLKTVESYKKAIKQDVTRINAQGTTRFWVYKDVELPSATGGKQKLPALICVVDDVAVKAVLKGKHPVCAGTCGLESGKVRFEAKQGKVPYTVLAKSVPLLLGKMVHMPSAADMEDDEAPSPPPQPPRPSAGGEGRYAQLNAEWKRLADQASKRMEANPGERARLKQFVEDIPKMLQGGQLGEAQKRIEQLQAALKIPPPPPPGAAGASADGRYAQLNTAWKQLSQQAAQRMAANPGERASLTELMKGLPEMLQGGQLGEAQKRLAQLQAALKAPAAGTPYPGIVKYRRALVEFAQAKSTAQAQIEALRRACLAEFPAEAEAAKGLVAELQELNNELSGAVDEAMKASENAASPATDAIKMKIRKYLTELASNALVKKVDSNPLGVQVTIAKTLGEALRRIWDAIPA